MQFEQILILLVLVLVPLANLLIQVWQKQQERKPPTPPPMPVPELAPAKKVPVVRIARQALRRPMGEAAAPPPVARVAGRTRTRRTLTLRRAVLSAEILGPCRALRPFEPGYD